VETSFSAASTRFCYDFETFSHVINVLILSIRLDTVFWYSLSRCICELDPDVLVFYAFGFALKSECDSTPFGSVKKVI
jgi:hypothetical protein